MSSLVAVGENNIARQYQNAEPIIGLIIGLMLVNLIAPSFGINVSSVIKLWIFIAAIICYAIVAERKLEFDGPLLRLFIFFYLFFVFRLAEFFWSDSPMMTLQEGLKTSVLALFTIAAYARLKRISIRDLEKASATIITTILFSSFLIYMYLLVGSGGFSAFGSKALKQYLLFFGGSNTAGAVILLLGLWNLILVLSGERNYVLIGLANLAMAIFLLVGIASFAAIAGFLAAVIAIIIFYLWRARHRLVLFFVIGLIGVSLYNATPYLQTVSLEDDGFETYSQREMIWAGAWDVIQGGAWLAGMGAGSWPDVTAKLGMANLLDADGNELRGGVHNALMQTWVEDGIIGLGMYLWLFGWLIKLGINSKAKNGFILSATAIAIAVRNFAESNGLLFGLINNSTVFFSWYVVVFLVVWAKKENQTESLSTSFNK